MSNVQPLDNDRHAHLRVQQRQLGEAINQVPVLASEFEEVQRHCPILFKKDEAGRFLTVAILGFDRDENLFLTPEGWEGYVPAMIRRGPFLIGSAETDEPVIHVDLDDPRLKHDGSEGMPLFLEHGGHAPALEAALGALRTIHAGARVAEPMQQLFDELDLAEPVDLTVRLGDGRAVKFEGYYAVTHEKIDALDGAALERLNRAGFLQPAVFAASSLYNMQRLVERKQRRDVATAGSP